MFKLAISNTVTFPVKGSINDAEGKALPFDFTFTADRSDAETIRANSEERIDLFLTSKIKGWGGVADPAGQTLTFSPDGLAQVLGIPGMVQLAWVAYMEACGAKGKAKN